ncbi:AAA family ATPase [Myxococcota bacterium]|nr:AAA family ATPase [Myxococcota bacterium]
MLTRLQLSGVGPVASSVGGLHRAVRTDTGQAVWVAAAPAGTAGLVARSRLRNEQAVLARLGVDDGVLAPLALIEDAEGLVLVLPDPGGRPLSAVERRPPLPAFLAMATRLARTLEAVHLVGVVHTGIDPDEILVDPQGRTWLTGFGDAARIGREGLAPVSLTDPDVRLAYISPEQTGRMNRSIDERTDLYSLGVVLFELLTGALPLAGRDAMGWVHAHIARKPERARALREDVPPVLCAILDRLLAKNADDRYQSAGGLARDLERCQADLSQRHGIHDFPLGQADRPLRFQVPDRLYGRDADVAALLQSFEAALDGAAGLCLVPGRSGIGKSRLISELHRPVVTHHAWFVQGKCDQYRRGQPYLALIRALSELVRQVLSEPEDRIAAWRDLVLGAVGPNGQLLIDVIPEVAFLVGPQPDVPELPAGEAVQRFNHTFLRFLQAVATGGRTLVLFLDDLQWVDAPTLALLEALLASPLTRNLLFIGAYRDNEVGDDHPLPRFIAAAERAGHPARTVGVGPLQPEHVGELVADALNSPRADCADLARIVVQKTGGNPFFIGQFLRRLHDDGIIRRTGPGGSWACDPQALDQAAYTDNVVELMAESLSQLPPDARRALATAAFLGTRFELLTLAQVLEQDLEPVAVALAAAVEAGLVLPEGDAARVLQAGRPDRPAHFRFLHDRVQEAAFGQVAEAERAALHLRIARSLSSRTDPEEPLFDIAAHVGQAIALVTDADEQQRFARLSLRAGQRAMASVAHDLATTCFLQGLALLGEGAWARDYATTLDLRIGAAEACYISRRPDDARAHMDAVLAHSQDLLDTIRVLELQVYFAFLAHDFGTAFSRGMEALTLLGYPLQDPPDPARFPEMLGAIARAQGGRSTQELALAAEATDPHAIAAMRLMVSLIPTIHGLRPELFAPLIFTGVHAFMSKGMSPAAGSLCTCYGLILGLQGAFSAAADFGRLGRAIVERYGNSPLSTPVYVQYPVFALHWSEPLRDLVCYLRQGIDRCREVGDIVNGGFCMLGDLFGSLQAGIGLDYLAALSPAYVRTLQEEAQFVSYNSIVPYAQVIDCLRGQAPDPGRLSGKVIDVDQHTAAMEALGFPLGLHYVHTAALYLSCLFGRWEQALVHGRQVLRHITANLGSYNTSWALAWTALALVRNAQQAQGEERQALLDELEGVLRNAQVPCLGLELIGTAEPRINNGHRLELVRAELARVQGQDMAAMRGHDLALELARTHGLSNDAALIAELAGTWHLAEGRDRIAATYLSEALDAWQEWGAVAKVEDLRARFGDLLSRRNPGRERRVAPAAPRAGGADALDLATVTKASTAIAGELVLDRLLDRLMRILLENAGARRAVLLLPREGGLRIAAVGSVEDGQVQVLDEPVPGRVPLATAVLNYVARTLEDVVIADCRTSQRFAGDTWLHSSGVRSVLCSPLLHQGELSAVIYLENDLAAGAFTPDRTELLRVLAGQAAIALDHARLYEELRVRSEELERKNVALTELDRLRDQFLANTSHELRTPLNGIIGIAESLLEGATGELSRPTRENLGLVVSSARRLSNLVNDLLDFSTLQHHRIELSRKPVDLRALTSAVLSLSQWLVGEKDLTLLNEVPDDLPAADADEDRLEQILTNLVGNAVKFTEAGTVRVRAARTDAGMLRLEVVDTGIGIRKEVQERIFESFEQADGSTSRLFGGTGLGLAVARELVQLHGGQIGVDSQPGRGATFWFTLPATERRAEVAPTAMGRLRAVPERVVSAPSPAVPVSVTEGAPRVLVVDDDATNLQVLVNQLTVRGFDVSSAVSGVHALNLIDGGYRPDLILLDVMMPTITGYDVTRTLRERFLPSELPIVLLTAKTLVKDLIEGLDAGANDYLTKPFSSGELLARLRMHLNLAQINRAVGRFVPADFLRLLERESIVDVRLGDSVERTMSVLFTDIRSFTSISERMSPRENFRFINEYLGHMEPVVVQHHGFIDKYIGDAVMALFDRAADDAVQAGIGMLRGVEEYNAVRRRRSERPIRIGVGVNSGSLMLGTVGGSGRMDGTVISDAVNLGSRLESLTKSYGVSMLITEHTHAMLRDPELYRLRRLDRIAVRGKHVPVTIYEVFDADPADELVGKLETRADFEDGVGLYHSGDWVGAHQAFLRVLHRSPTDLAAEHYVDRCRRRVRAGADSSVQ